MYLPTTLFYKRQLLGVGEFNAEFNAYSGADVVKEKVDGPSAVGPMEEAQACQG